MHSTSARSFFRSGKTSCRSDVSSYCALVNRLIPRTIAILALLGIIPSAPAKPVDLARFRGVYHGKVAVTLSGRTYPGVARIVVRAGKLGRSATMSVAGEFSIHGRTFPISNRLTFSRSRNFTERSIANGFTGASVRVTGPYVAHRRDLSFSAPFAVNNVSGTAIGTAAIHRGRQGNQVLALNTSIAFHGQPQDYLFDFQASKYVEP